MKTEIYSQIIGVGIDDPSNYVFIPNSHFEKYTFFENGGVEIKKSTSLIVKKFEERTGTISRYYAKEGLVTSNLAIGASKNAIASANLTPHDIDCIIVAHNSGDVYEKKDKMDVIPCQAARVKHHLKIANPSVVAYDIAIGGPDSTIAFSLFEKHLGLGPKDMVIHVNGTNYDEKNLFGEADSLAEEFVYLGVSIEELHSIVVVHFLGVNTPSIANKVKTALGITDPNILGYDLFFGCAAALQAMIQADAMIKRSAIKTPLIAAAENLPAIADKHDKDIMLYASGGTAIVMTAVGSDVPVGLIAHRTRSDTLEHMKLICMDEGFHPDRDPEERFLKMDGPHVHTYALKGVAVFIKKFLDDLGISLDEIDEIDIHQPNPLMLTSRILPGIFEQFGVPVREDIMPVIGHKYGNPSVVCLFLIYYLSCHGLLKNKKVKSGGLRLFVTFGAGMSLVVVLYREP